jgi:two-component system sensor histidine kinase YesM
MKRLAWIANLSLKKKPLLLLAAVGLVPLTITFFISYSEIRKSARQSQSYAANQNFEQTLATLSGRLS